jgi:hypothetical protein
MPWPWAYSFALPVFSGWSTMEFVEVFPDWVLVSAAMVFAIAIAAGVWLVIGTFTL